MELSGLDAQTLKDVVIGEINNKTKTLIEELELLLIKKEQLDIAIEKKSTEIQELKYALFDEIEAQIPPNDTITLNRLYQIKLQSIDLYDILSEAVESAIIATIEKSKDYEARHMIEEIVKELTYETIKEGALSTLRIRKILSTILNTAIEVAEATPNQLEEILEATLRGMRSGLMASIDRFKKRLAFTPLEAKHILIRDYDTIMQDLNHTDTLFSQVVQNSANESEAMSKKILLDINAKMRYDLDELVHISKETALVMRDRFSSFAKKAVKKADHMLGSKTASGAKKVGVDALSAARLAFGHVIKNAKNIIEHKK